MTEALTDAIMITESEAAMTEKLMALPREAFDRLGIFVPDSSLSPIRIMAEGDEKRLLRVLSETARTVLSDTETAHGDFELKKYNLYVLRADISAPVTDGILASAGEETKEALIRLIKTMFADIGRTVTDGEAERFAEGSREDTYILGNGRALAMGRIAFEGAAYGRINTVVCLPEARGRGYGADTVRALCSVLIGKSLIPTALADADNGISNKMYLSLGFKNEGILYEYTPKGKALGENALTCGSLS